MAAACLKKSYNKNLKHGLLANDQLPKRRKRHYGRMSFLMLLIFVSCCLTLIFKPLHVQAKELYNATSKGENILNNDRQSHQHDEAEININADKTNDNATFKRVEASGSKIGNADAVAEEEDEHSTEVIEMIQPAHTLRHQEHYKQRILLGERHKQQQQQQQHVDESANDDIIDGDADAEVQERELTQYNRNLRYEQIQRALREPIASPPPHHRRHEHHFDKQRLAKQTELTWPQQQHHLRHQHHQAAQELQHHSQPQLRHLKHEMRKQNITATNMKQLLPHQRYFDRESSYMYPTEGPLLRHTGSTTLHWKSIAYLHNPHNRLASDDEGNNNHRNEDEDIKRFSLSLVDGHEIEQQNVKANKGKDTLHKNKRDEDEDGRANYDEAKANNSDNDNDNDNDYSYEDDDDDGDADNKEINKQNNYPSISAGYNKINVKRYTNPLRELHRPSSPSTGYGFRSPLQPGHHLRHTDAWKTNSNNENKEENDDDGDDYDDTENTEDDNDEESSSSTSDESSDDDDDNDDDKLSYEKWNKIEHEHYRKQLQHQHAMQALRSRRPQNDNTLHTSAAVAAAAAATTTTHNNKYSSYTPSSLAAPASLYTSAWKKRQILNEDESDNIYSRYYVPGSVTRKKEEELGSPTAILESRRQYALQQRQNKALASAHHRRIVTEGTCRWPQPRVERIRKDSWKIYTPHCTILHRCADDAGCCPSERQTCAAKRTKTVDLYFFVISLNETQGAIEKLTFVNHTECHCINRSKQRAPEYGSSGAKDLMAVNNQIPYLRRATILNCYCPNLFEKILQEDGFCRCDCSSGNMGCDWLKRGMEHFSMNDRKCIIEGRCKLPTCEYGQYIKKHGRCPRREERHLSADGDW